MKRSLLPRVIGANFICSVCNRSTYIDKLDISSSIYKYIEKYHVCKECAYWMNVIDNPDNVQYIIIHGAIYKEPPEDVISQSDKYIYIMFNNLSVIKLRKVIKIGNIPQRFRNKLEDNAHFIDKKAYSILKVNDFKCLKKGCYDRYHCIRYSMEAESEGAWNVIPKSHKVGDEKCPSFVDKYSIT